MNSSQLFIFIAWIFSRISFERRSIPFNNQIIDLDAGEFLFGRRICSEETGISEQSIRTILTSLVAQGVLQKSTSKSTNKFTIYTLLWSHFSENNQPAANQQVTGNQPAANHNQEERIKKASYARARK